MSCHVHCFVILLLCVHQNTNMYSCLVTVYCVCYCCPLCIHNSAPYCCIPPPNPPPHPPPSGKNNAAQKSVQHSKVCTRPLFSPEEEGMTFWDHPHMKLCKTSHFGLENLWFVTEMKGKTIERPGPNVRTTRSIFHKIVNIGTNKPMTQGIRGLPLEQKTPGSNPGCGIPRRHSAFLVPIYVGQSPQ